MVCPDSPPVYRGCSIASGTSPAGPMGREALGAPWDPSNAVARTSRGALAPAVRQHHMCRAAIKECGASPQAPPTPVPWQSWGGQAVCLCDLEAALPCPVSPLVGSVSGSPSLPTRARSTGLTHSPQLPSGARPPTHTCTMTASPAHLRCGVVHGGCTSPLSLGTGQLGSGTSAAQGRTRWPAIPACARPCPDPTQPNPRHGGTKENSM